MPSKYRWRDKLEHGDWKDTREAAREDAVREKRAHREPYEPFQFIWNSPWGEDRGASMKEHAVTLPLDVLEAVVEVAKRFHPNNLKPRERKALAIAERELEMVKDLGEAAQYTRLPGYLPQFRDAMAKGRSGRLL